ncbi:MAG: hypothetical protein IRY96_06110, partial [Burkholderiales bacterium]|nr:hypothetical protein [Burkholderiales bacterium]
MNYGEPVRPGPLAWEADPRRPATAAILREAARSLGYEQAYERNPRGEKQAQVDPGPGHEAPREARRRLIGEQEEPSVGRTLDDVDGRDREQLTVPAFRL